MLPAAIVQDVALHNPVTLKQQASMQIKTIRAPE